MGCPLEHASEYYVPDDVQPESSVFILLGQPDYEDERLGVAGSGQSSHTLNTTYLPLAGLQRGPGVSVGHVIRCRSGQAALTALIRQQAAGHCAAAYSVMPSSVAVVVTYGELAFHHANNHSKHVARASNTIFHWRGFILPEHINLRPIFVTLNATEIRGNDPMLWVSEVDWRHLGDILLPRFGLYPTPPRQLRAAEDHVNHDMEDFFSRANKDSGYLTIDTEYIPGTTHLTIFAIGFWRNSDHAEAPDIAALSSNSDRDVRPGGGNKTAHCGKHEDFHVLSINWQESSYPVKDWLRYKILEVVGKHPTVFHNAHADLIQLQANLQIHYRDYKQIEDTMLAHAVQWCELPHTLDFLSSVYGEYGKFKHLWDVDPVRYNYGDVVDTWSAWKALSRGFERDAAAERVYREQSLALIPLLLAAAGEGVRVNTSRVAAVYQQYAATLATVKDYAALAVGYPINLNSGQQLKHYLYTERRFKEQVDRKTRRPTTNDDAIARLRQAQGIVYDTTKEYTFDHTDEHCYSVLDRVSQGADPILECRALWAGMYQLTNNYIIGLGKGVYGEHIKPGARKKARTAYWKDGLSDSDVVSRVYPNFAIHAQKTGRWSTTNPPLAQLPSSLRDIVCPSADDVCISWDWSAIEPRILQALTGSTLLKKTFDDGFDLHTWTVCYMFGYEMPPDLVDPHKSTLCEAWRTQYRWQGKEDPRRVFAKQARYEMWYGGSGRNAAQAAAQFGLNATDLRVALSKLATSDPAYYAWKTRNEAEVKKTAMVRTFMGRPRRFLGSGDARRREGLDQPMQGAVSDIFNTTAVLLAARIPGLRWGWGMHDSQKWWIHAALLTPAVFESIRLIVERVHCIGGQDTRFPGDFEIILPPERGGHKFTVNEYFHSGITRGNVI